jgi:hypothetical protein
MIKSLRMRWEKNKTRIGEIRNAYKVLVGKPEGKTLGRPRRRWKRMLKWIERVWTGFIWLTIGTGDWLL